MNLCDTIITISILLHITTADTPLILLYYYYNIIIFVINFNILLYNSLVIVQQNPLMYGFTGINSSQHARYQHHSLFVVWYSL